MSDKAPKKPKGSSPKAFEHYRRKLVKKETKDKISEKLDDVSKGLVTVSANMQMIRDFMPIIIAGTPIHRLDEEWSAQIEAIVLEHGDNAKAEAPLGALAKRMMDGMKEVQEVSIAYIEKMILMAAGKQATPEILLRMRDGYSTKALKMARIFSSKNKEAKNAVKYVLGLTAQTDKTFEPVKKFLISTLSQSAPSYSGVEAGWAWFAFNFLPNDKKDEIVKAMIKENKLKGAELKKFLISGVEKGAISTIYAMEFVEFTELEERALAIVYKQQTDFAAKARRYCKTPPGSRNYANDNMTLGNAMLTFGQFAAAVSIVGTATTHILMDKGYTKPDQIIEGIFNPGNAINAGIIAFGHYAKHPNPNLFVGSEDQKTQRERKSADDLHLVFNGNLGLKRALTGDEHLGDFTGAEILGEYITQVCYQKKGEKTSSIQTDLVRIAKFKTWLEAKAKSTGGKYKILNDKIVKRGKGFIVKGAIDWPLTTGDFGRIVNAFDVHNIDGKKSPVKNAFLSAWNGTYKKKAKKTK